MRRGVTLIEMALVVALISVLVAVGWGSLRSELPRFQMIRAAKMLQADLRELQSTAVATNRETRLVLTGSPGTCDDIDSWGGSWSLQIGNRNRGSDAWEYLPPDAQEDGSDDDASRGTVDLGPGGAEQRRFVCLEQWNRLTGPGDGNSDAVVFSPRGWVSNPGGDFGTRGYIELTIINLAAAEGVDDEVEVLVARSGHTSLQTSHGTQAPAHSVGTSSSSTTVGGGS